MESKPKTFEGLMFCIGYIVATIVTIITLSIINQYSFVSKNAIECKKTIATSSYYVQYSAVRRFPK